MFILTLSYTAPLDAIDRLRDAHMAWIADQYENDNFLVSGPKVPRTGGVILARAMPRADLDALIAADPFSREGVATYEVTEFAALTVAPGLDALREGDAPPAP